MDLPVMKRCPRCGRLMPYGPQYCSACEPLAAQELEARREENARRKDASYNRTRDPKYVAFYRSKAWKATSRAYLESVAYRCEAHASESCTGLAVEVHHKQPIRTPTGWDRRLDWSNLEAVCTACHNSRHADKLRRENPGVVDLKTVRRD